MSSALGNQDFCCREGLFCKQHSSQRPRRLTNDVDLSGQKKRKKDPKDKKERKEKNKEPKENKEVSHAEFVFETVNEYKCAEILHDFK